MNLIMGFGLQRAYLNKDGPWYIENQSEILDTRLKYYLSTINMASTHLYVVREVHQPNDSFFRHERTGALVGSDDIDIPEFYRAKSKLVFNSMRYNAFYMTLLDSEVHKLKPERVYLVGFETHTSILFNAEEFRNRGYEVTVIEPLILSRDEYLHAAGINLMRNFLGVDIQQ